MSKFLKWFLILLFIVVGLALTGYGAYRLYNYVIADATARIKQGVAEGVGGAINPLSWPGKIIGGEK